MKPRTSKQWPPRWEATSSSPLRVKSKPRAISHSSSGSLPVWVELKAHQFPKQRRCFPHGRFQVTFSRAWSDWITALGQAKVEYCRFSLDLARRHGARVFATIVPREAPRAERGDSLGKGYAFLFERFYDFLNGLPGDPMGSLVFDELDRSCRSIRPP